MISIENVYKKYGKTAVLKGVSFNCEIGRTYNLIGINGAGKSTLINIISGLLMADQGKVYINNADVNSPDESYRCEIGYVFEKPYFIEKLTAIEYMKFAGKLFSLSDNYLDDRICKLINFFELENDIGKTIEEYSKGMKSKISIASALLHEPKYLILDEPFDGIDFLMMQKVIELFKQLNMNGTTILLTSQHMDINVNLADHFFVLADGIIKHSFTITELNKRILEKANPYREYRSYFHKLLLG